MSFLLPQLKNPNQMKISVAVDKNRKSMFFRKISASDEFFRNFLV